jgi:hypothetical protein
MGNVPGRTDYMSVTEFQRRALAAMERGDQPKPRKLLILDVPYTTEFDVFAANVAYAIRGEVVYRSDGGVFARGFVLNANAFLKHLQSLLRDPNSLYNTYTRYTQASPGVFGTF